MPFFSSCRSEEHGDELARRAGSVTSPSISNCTGTDWLRSAQPEPRNASGNVRPSASLRWRSRGCGNGVETQRFDPQPAGSTIWNTTALGCAICPATGTALGDHAVDRRDQRFRLAAHFVERDAAVLEAFKLEFGFFKLDCAIAPLGASRS